MKPALPSMLVGFLVAVTCGCTPLHLRTDYAPQLTGQRDVEEVQILSALPAGDAVTVLGELHISPDTGFFHNYRSEWRNGYCGAQRPLVVATLFLWELIPTYWPCYKDEHYPIVEFDAAAMAIAKESGGDTVVLEYIDRDDEDQTARAARGVIARTRPSAEPFPGRSSVD